MLTTLAQRGRPSIPCPTCPRRMATGRECCCMCMQLRRGRYGVPQIKCPKCYRYMSPKRTACLRCEPVVQRAAYVRKRELDQEKLADCNGLSLARTLVTIADEDALRNARVTAYAAQVERAGVIDYQSGIRVAAGVAKESVA